MWHKNKHVWSMDFQQRGRSMGKKGPLTKRCWTTGHALTEGRGTQLPATKTSQLVKDLRVLAKTVKLLKET